MLIYSFVSRVASIFNGIVYFCSFSHRFIDFTVSAVFIASLNKILRNVLKRQETLEYRAMTQYRWEIPISNKNHILRLEGFPLPKHWFDTGVLHSSSSDELRGVAPYYLIYTGSESHAFLVVCSCSFVYVSQNSDRFCIFLSLHLTVSE